MRYVILCSLLALFNVLKTISILTIRLNIENRRLDSDLEDKYNSNRFFKIQILIRRSREALLCGHRLYPRICYRPAIKFEIFYLLLILLYL